jgi:peptide methionine sulfoxide reductase msrA/msrB
MVDMETKVTKTDEQWRAELSPEQYDVLRHAATERPFTGEYVHTKDDGTYRCAACDAELFSSDTKFDSGTGWPSFSKPLEQTNVIEKTDSSHGMRRVEVRSKTGDAHLCHLFDDGPGPAGQRFCMNSASLRFIPAEKLQHEGYGQYAKLFPNVKQIGAVPEAASAAPKTGSSGPKAEAGQQHEVAILAGGCFWGMENIIRKIPGVIATDVGYSGGSLQDPSYQDVTTGRTGHAESVRVTFDPKVLSYEALLGYFFRMHDPTTLNRQENDVGTQYRSAIFYTSDAQRKTAEAVKQKVDQSHKWKSPVVTQVAPLGKFYLAEEYHQDYLVAHPDGYNCHVLRD